MTFSSFLKRLDKRLFSEYVFSKFEEKKQTGYKKPEVFANDFAVGDLTGLFKDNETGLFIPCKKLPKNHSLRNYLLEQRQLPEKAFNQLGFTPKFRQFTNSFLPGKFSKESLCTDYQALIIPLRLAESESVFGFQGRALEVGAPRYTTILLDERRERYYNLDRLQTTSAFFVVEGPIDCMFLSNAVAVCGSDFLRVLDNIPNAKENATFVLDNEPRNLQIVKKFQKLIAAGVKLAILPSEFEGCDINDIILMGYNSSEVEELLRRFTYEGLKAKIVFENWRKV